MQATIGTRLVIHGRTLGVPDRHCVVIGVGGRDNAPPYTVRWDDGHENIFFPGPDAALEPGRDAGKAAGKRAGRR